MAVTLKKSKLVPPGCGVDERKRDATETIMFMAHAVIIAFGLIVLWSGVACLGIFAYSLL